jgi:hypothetical protein
MYFYTQIAFAIVFSAAISFVLGFYYHNGYILFSKQYFKCAEVLKHLKENESWLSNPYLKEMARMEVRSENNKALFLCVNDCVNERANIVYVTMEVLTNNKIEMVIGNTVYFIFYNKAKKKSFADDIRSIAVKNLRRHRISVIASICSERGALAVV